MNIAFELDHRRFDVNDADRLAVVILLIAFDVDVFFRLAVQNLATHKTGLVLLYAELIELRVVFENRAISKQPTPQRSPWRPKAAPLKFQIGKLEGPGAVGVHLQRRKANAVVQLARRTKQQHRLLNAGSIPKNRTARSDRDPRDFIRDHIVVELNTTKPRLVVDAVDRAKPQQRPDVPGGVRQFVVTDS